MGMWYRGIERCGAVFVSARSCGCCKCVVNKVRGKISFDGETYNVVIGGWSKVGRVGEIERILKEMVADGFDPDGSTFSFLIEGLGRAGRIGDAVEIFEKMEKETGCAPDTVVYNAMISNFISVGDLDESSYGPPHAALIIYKKARAVGCRISLSAYKLLLMRLSTFGKSGMLLNIWDEMQGSAYSFDVEVYEHVINGLCNNGQLENAILLMEEGMSKGFCPSRRTSSF